MKTRNHKYNPAHSNCPQCEAKRTHSVIIIQNRSVLVPKEAAEEIYRLRDKLIQIDRVLHPTES